MKHFVVLTVNLTRGSAASRFEDQVNDHLAKGYEFLGPPQAEDPMLVAFMLKEDDSA